MGVEPQASKKNITVGTIVSPHLSGSQPGEGWIEELFKVFRDIPLREAMYMSKGRKVWISVNDIDPNLGGFVLVEVVNVIRDTSESGEVYWKCGERTGVVTYGGGFNPDVWKADQEELIALLAKYPDRFTQLS